MAKKELRSTPPSAEIGVQRKRLKALGLRGGLRSSKVGRPGAGGEEADAGFFWREAAYYCGLAEAMDHAGLRDLAVDLAMGCEAAARRLEGGGKQGKDGVRAERRARL